MIDPYVQPYSLTLNRFLEHAAKWSPHTGIVTANAKGEVEHVRYPELLARSRRVSAGLSKLGVRQGECVATLAWNTQGHVEAWYGVSGIGAIVHTLNPRLSDETLAAMVRASGSRILIAAASLAAQATALARLAPALERILLIDDASEADIGTSSAISRLEDVMAPDKGAAWGQFDETTPAGLCFTSGTTGKPKGVVYTHRSSYLHTLRLLQADVIGPTAQDVILMVVPMFHANGWGLPFAAPAVGAKLVLPGRHSDGASLARLIQSENVTLAAAVPTVWLGLLEHLEAEGGELPSLKRIIVGGAPMGQQLMDRIEERLGVIVQTSWGMTELTPLGAIAPQHLPHRAAASAGRIAIGLDLCLKDADGQTLPDQRSGEGRLYVKGQSAVHRYHGEASPAVDSEGWFDTGDLARIGEDGSLFITGRSKDLIKSGGEWINPAEIEALVATSPDVALAAVIARRHEKWGERPVLVVEVREGAEPSDETLLKVLDGKTPTWWRPDAVVRVHKMPLAATGKIDKQRLRADFG